MSFCQNQCGLPSNLTSYPRFAQEEIRAVWKNYIPGTKCDQELLITEDIFTVLNSFNKEIDKDMPAMPIIDLGNIMGQDQEMLSQPTPTQVMPAMPIIDMRQNQEMLPQPTTTQTTTSATTTTTSTSNLEATTEHDYLDFILPGNPTPGHFIPITSTSTLFSSTISNLVESPKPISGDTSEDYDYLDKKGPLAARPLVRPVKPKKPTQIFPSFVKNSGQNSESAQTDESNDYDEKTPTKMLLSEMRLKLPFLQHASLSVIRKFQKVFNDPNIPSEGLREEEIHLLAVSYLDDQQLKSFNVWGNFMGNSGKACVLE
uniref:Uncharacterized protein n=1 Tax=Acrobeloides nanus TaxID=290746 RepID=A0A914EK35_9BILA